MMNEKEKEILKEMEVKPSTNQVHKSVVDCINFVIALKTVNDAAMFLQFFPLSMEFALESGLKFEKSANYAIIFSMANDQNRAAVSNAGALNGAYRCDWNKRNVCKVAVNDTLEDKHVTCTLVRLTGERNIDLAVAQVCAKKLAKIYTAQSTMYKTHLSFSTIAMKSIQSQKPVGTLKTRILFNQKVPQ